MRVLIASDHFPPFIGGAHRWAPLLADGLARRGHDVHVATVWHVGLPREETYGHLGLPVHRVRQLRTATTAIARHERQRHSPPFPDPVTIVDLRRAVRTARPEIVLSHGWLTFSVIGALARTGIPLVGSAHDYGYFCPNRTLLHKGKPCTGPRAGKCLGCASEFYGVPKGPQAVAGVALSRRLTARRISAIQSVTSFVDQQEAAHLLSVRPHGLAPVKRFIAPAFVEVDPPPTAEEEAETERILARLPSEFIMFVGALRPLKGLEVLFDAYRRLDSPPPLVLMGTVERDTPPLPDAAIVITDVPHRAVMAAWSRAMVGVAPSVWPEPLGTVTVEGITQGTPMIATVPSGMIDVLGDGAGILVEQGDASALADALGSLIASPERRAALSAAARERAKRFEPEAVITRYERMLESLVGR
jgi:glycosyltransferase involved in cell wall biosynthesis